MMLAYIQPLELQISRTNPNQLVERVLSAVDMEIKEKNLRIDLQLSPNLPVVSVDRPKMELAVETLVKKAVNQMQKSFHKEDNVSFGKVTITQKKKTMQDVFSGLF